MSAVDPGEEFWGNLAAEQDFLDPDADDAWAHENEEFVDEDDDSSGCAVFDLSSDGSYGLSLSATTTEVADNDPPDVSDSNVVSQTEVVMTTHQRAKQVMLDTSYSMLAVPSPSLPEPHLVSWLISPTSFHISRAQRP
eukprot:scaffold21863_cov68-Cyclotella_meneghiniana.AAC.3